MSLFVFVFEKNICFYPNSPSSPRKGRRGQGKPKDQKIQGEHFYIWIKTNQKLQCAFLLLIVGQNRQPSDSKSLWSRFREPAGEPSTNIDKVLTLQVFHNTTLTTQRSSCNFTNKRNMLLTLSERTHVPRRSCYLCNVYRWSWLSESLTSTKMDFYLGMNSARSTFTMCQAQ